MLHPRRSHNYLVDSVFFSLRFLVFHLFGCCFGGANHNTCCCRFVFLVGKPSESYEYFASRTGTILFRKSVAERESNFFSAKDFGFHLPGFGRVIVSLKVSTPGTALVQYARDDFGFSLFSNIVSVVLGNVQSNDFTKALVSWMLLDVASPGTGNVVRMQGRQSLVGRLVG